MDVITGTACFEQLFKLRGNMFCYINVLAGNNYFNAQNVHRHDNINVHKFCLKTTYTIYTCKPVKLYTTYKSFSGPQ